LMLAPFGAQQQHVRTLMAAHQRGHHAHWGADGCTLTTYADAE